jgi:hypothetical protein
MLPRIKITDLLIEFDQWTNFTGHFTHLHNGEVVSDRALLLSAILADGINLGIPRMAEACPGISASVLSRIATWHIREETYTKALAEIVNHHHQIEFAGHWGAGSTSSSDGQRFRTKQITAHWDEVLRLASSIQQGTVTASLMLRKLGAYPRQNALALALREIGKLERTLFLLEFIQNIELQKRIHAGLQAEPLLRRALAITEKGLGPDGRQTLAAVNNLAFLFDAKGDLAGATWRQGRNGLSRRPMTLNGRPVDLAVTLAHTWRTSDRIQFGGMRVLLRELPAGGCVDGPDGFDHFWPA